MDSWTFFVDTFGCKVNQHESQLIREAWHALGGVETSDPAMAQYILINSCAITSKAERDARNAITRFRKASPLAKIILSGCAAQFLSTFTPRKNANFTLPDFRVSQSEKSVLLQGPWPNENQMPQNNLSNGIYGYQRSRPVIKIQDGCTQNCTYCIVPQTRSILSSASPEEIANQCRALAHQGFCEIIISGINLRQYGKDKPEYGDFWDMLANLDNILWREFRNKTRLRISSLEPAQLSVKALTTLENCRLVCPHLHLSLQHASSKVLKRMGRGHYDIDKITEFLAKLSTHWPVMGLGADILVGFPGETEDDFNLLTKFIEDSPLTYAHVFPYSRRQGTAALNFPDHIPQKIKIQRAAHIRERIEVKKMAFWQKLTDMGIKMRVIAEQEQKSGHLQRGVNQYYTPCYFMPEDLDKNASHMWPVKCLKDGILCSSDPHIKKAADNIFCQPPSLQTSCKNEKN